MISIDFFKAIFDDITSFFAKRLDFGTPLATGSMIIWALIAGFAIGAFICLYNRVFLGRFVAYLIKSKANCPENAKSITDAGVSNVFLRKALKSDSLFSKIIKTEDTDKGDIEKVSFFIPEENVLRAERLYSRNGASPVSVIISFVLLIILAAIAYIVLPELIVMAENFGNMIKNG